MVIPNHVAIILDGNGRWAKRKGCQERMGMSKAVKIWKNLFCCKRTRSKISDRICIFYGELETIQRRGECADEIIP